MTYSFAHQLNGYICMVRLFWDPCTVQKIIGWQIYWFHCGNEWIFVVSHFRLHIWNSTRWNVWGCMSSWGWKLSNWKSERKREKAFEVVEYLGNHVTWQAPNARFIFARDKTKMRGCSWKHTAHDYSVQSGSQNYLIYRRPTTFVSGRNESWILF